MKQLVDKAIGYATFIVVFFIHIYFALLLGAKPALAQETVPATDTIKVEKSAPKSVASPKSATTQSPPSVPQPPIPPTPPKPPKLSDTELNIKFDTKDGLTIKGLEKMIERLEAIDQKGNNIVIGDGEDDDEGGGGAKVIINDRKFRSRGGASEWVAILVPLSFFALIFGLIFAKMYFTSRTRKEYLETVRLLVEKGQPIPTDLMSALHEPTSLKSDKWAGYQSHVIKGLAPIFWGIGIVSLIIFEHFDAVPWFFGFVFILIGAHHIVKSHLIQKEREKNPPAPVVEKTDITTNEIK